MDYSALPDLDIDTSQVVKDFIAYIKSKTGLQVVLKQAPQTQEKLAKSNYVHGSNVFTISLEKDCEEVHLIHELIHAEVRFISQFHILEGNSDKWVHPCDLIRDVMEDCIVHRGIANRFKLVPFDKDYLNRISKFAEDLRKGGSISNETERNRCPFCEPLYITLEAIQVYDYTQPTYSSVIKEWQHKILNKFVIYFEKSRSLNSQILDIYKKLKILYRETNFGDRDCYRELLEKVCQLSNFEINGEKLVDNKKIFYFVKQNDGFIPDC